MNQRQNPATAENRSARRIAFVQACWHKDIVDRCRVSFTAEIAKHGYGDGDIDFFEVPGSLDATRAVARRERALCRHRRRRVRRQWRHLPARVRR